jgi:hypothetical protein
MLKRSLLLCGLAVTALCVSSCLFDPDENPPDDGPGTDQVVLQDLSQRWHVLNNIEYAYKTRNKNVYDELLNTEFTFYFSPGDVGGGSPEQFDRVEELDATGRLFLSNQQPTNPPEDPVCRSMRLDLVFDKDNLNWVEVIPENNPSELWYTTTVFYTFTFEIEPNTTYIAQNGAKAQFTIRNNPSGGKDHWELVEFRDLGS